MQPANQFSKRGASKTDGRLKRKGEREREKRGIEKERDDWTRLPESHRQGIDHGLRSGGGHRLSAVAQWPCTEKKERERERA